MLSSGLRLLTTWRSAVLAVAVTLFALVAAAATTALPARAADQPHSATKSYAVGTAEPRPGLSSNVLYFRNYYKNTAYVAVKYRDFSGACDDYGGWATSGWYKVDRGQTVRVLNTTNRYAYFYAEADGSTWSGTDSTMYIPTDGKRFDSCTRIDGPGWKQVGVDIIDMGPTFVNYTMELRAP